MLGQYSTGRSSSFDSRIFVYELTGMADNEATVGQAAPIRTSSSQFIQVPYGRMNEEMRRITMLGGKIVSIRPLGAASDAAAEE